MDPVYVSIRFHAPFGRVIRGLSLSNRSKVIFQQPPPCFEANSGKSLTHGESSEGKFFFSPLPDWNNKRTQGAIYCSGIVPPFLIMLLHLVTPLASVLFRAAPQVFRDCTGSTLLLFSSVFLFLFFSFQTHTHIYSFLFSSYYSFFLSFFSFSYFSNETSARACLSSTRKCSM